MGRIIIAPGITIDESHLTWEFVRASGPGGQNVNKVATAVKLRLDLNQCADLPDSMRSRLVRLAGSKMTTDGVLIIDARRFRTQERNRQDALERLETLLKTAARTPKIRRPTRPSKISREKLKAAKLHRQRIKKLRRPIKDREC